MAPATLPTYHLHPGSLITLFQGLSLSQPPHGWLKTSHKSQSWLKSIPVNLKPQALAHYHQVAAKLGIIQEAEGAVSSEKDTSNFIQMRLRLCVGEGALLPWDEDPGGFPFVFQTKMFQPLIFCGWWP